ncbi:Uncharacterized oxidoreductase yciK [Cedecea neteri]|uniref:Uncharacterized oxidoreductase yciK n=1 Tax=Cedecea neteri TaxID=158822 RepID=A0A2X3JBP1_9ENTR|nr:Uncharacterized oxidoreductase yciK [Cedecea neteri]
MDEQDPDTWQAVMQVNVNATFFLTQALLPLLLKSEFRLSGLHHFQRWAARVAPAGELMPHRSLPPEGMMQVLA